MSLHYTPSNGTEFEIFLQQCFTCKHFDDAVLNNDAEPTCPMLRKLFYQMVLNEQEEPDIYWFNDDELQMGKYPPPRCLKWESRS